MTKGQKEALITLFDFYVDRVAECRALKAILAAARELGDPNVQAWEKDLPRLKQAPEFHAIYEQFAPLRAQLERVQTDDQAIELFGLIPKPNLVN